MDTIKTLVIGESVAQVFNHFSRRTPADISGFWRHSLTTALLTREIAALAAYPHAEEAYLAGLLHDVGRLALVCASPEEYGEFFQSPDTDAVCDREKASLQITHAEAGAWIAEQWKLDSFLSDSILYHHQPPGSLGSAPLLVRICVLANRLAEHGPDSTEAQEAATLCKIPPTALPGVAASAAAQVGTAAAQLGIELAPHPSPEGSPSSHEKLAAEVQQLILTSTATRPLLVPQDEQLLLRSLVQSACMLFDLDDAAVLLLDPVEGLLNGVPLDKELQRLAQISLPLSTGTPIADAVLGKAPMFVSADSSAISVGEKQLLRILGTEAAICLPLAGNPHALGALVCALRPAQFASLRTKAPLFQAFAAQAAAALGAARNAQGERHESLQALREEYEGAAKRMAHEANNPLAIIRNYLAILEGKLSKQEAPGGEIAILNEEIERVGSILRSFRNRTPAGASGNTDVNRVARDVVRLFAETGFAHAALKISAHTGEAALNARADAQTVRQILINLIKNAVEAMPNGGEIRVTANGMINFGGQMFIQLSVRDTGPGISEERLGAIFHPLESSKAGENRGLGLSIVNEQVEKLGGQAICSSSAEGTSFTVLLPAQTAAPRLPADSSTS